MPSSNFYVPIQVGAAISPTLNFTKDNTGDNISDKNPLFCELTALYWAWKNSSADYIGLVHYRRHFSGNNHFIKVKNKKVLDPEKLQNTLKNSDLILPRKRHYFIMNLYDHYAKTMREEHLIATEKIITNQCPEYLPEFQKLKTHTSMHAFNMFVMKRELLDQYCSWLFPILFALEKEIDVANYTSFEKRYIGRISERLLDVWINTNHLPYTELRAINIEPTNWLKKGSGFLAAKFTGRKYEKSL